MSEDVRQGEWIGDWIEGQRRAIEQLGEALKGGAPLGEAFCNVGQQWGEELLKAWQAAWGGASSTGASVAQAFAELLGRAPPLGLAREQTQAWRELVSAQAECHKLEQELRAVLTRVQSDALALLQERANEMQRSGKPIESYRELYDLWVECGEKVYAEVAHSEPYSRLQAELGNATMRLRSRLQSVIESGLRQLDLPTRSELNTVHQQLRALRDRVAELEKALAASTQGASS